MTNRFAFRFYPLSQTKRLLLFLAQFVAYFSASENIAQACAMCQTVMPRGNDPMARGLFWGVLILLVAPFLVAGLIGAWLYYHSRIVRRTSGTARLVVLSVRDQTQDQQ